MWVIRNKILPFTRHSAINLFGMLFVKRDVKVTPSLINHERIHTAQMLELLVIPFYIWYVVEWLVRFAKIRDGMRAYYMIGFEREAYGNEHDLGYLRHRRLFAFWKWMK